MTQPAPASAEAAQLESLEVEPLGPLHLFEAVGIELEYMLVDRESLDVRPIADQLLTRVAGETTLSVERGPIAWSNELALHVIELKTNGPTSSLPDAAGAFQASLSEMQGELEHLGARLLPSGMHPWMDPIRELRLWPHEQDEIYRAFDRIFDCTGHGWANLQSMHINLPFADDAEFGRLHAAIRLILPLLPALAASSPFEEGRATGVADTRLHHYRSNAARIPSVSGVVIPERVYSHADYERLLQTIYDDLAPHDPEGILVGEWVNARGAIARFERGAIEIRVLDTQECPRADLSIATLTTAAVRTLTERTPSEASLFAWDEQRLERIFDATVRLGEKAVIEDADYLALFGARHKLSAQELWSAIAERVLTSQERTFADAWLTHYAQHGCLSSRITARSGQSPSRQALQDTYGELARCLANGLFFA
jgi:gamma-glutamyl:cysteine ligase YbdK (ATP-grasp superfamily)